MGSSGTGRLSDYPGGSADKSSEGNGSGGSSPRGSEDRCGRTFTAILDDVAMSDYYVGSMRLPSVGTTVVLEKRKRIVAQLQSGESIGSLPTAFNYIVGCMNDGWKYVGNIRVSSESALGPVVSVDITPVSS